MSIPDLPFFRAPAESIDADYQLFAATIDSLNEHVIAPHIALSHIQHMVRLIQAFQGEDAEDLSTSEENLRVLARRVSQLQLDISVEIPPPSERSLGEEDTSVRPPISVVRERQRGVSFDESGPLPELDTLLCNLAIRAQHITLTTFMKEQVEEQARRREDEELAAALAASVRTASDDPHPTGDSPEEETADPLPGEEEVAAELPPPPSITVERVKELLVAFNTNKALEHIHSLGLTLPANSSQEIKTAVTVIYLLEQKLILPPFSEELSFLERIVDNLRTEKIPVLYEACWNKRAGGSDLRDAQIVNTVQRQLMRNIQLFL